MTKVTKPRFSPSQLDEIEGIEEYRPGGFHPIVIGDLFAHGRYRIIHKLGFGGSSTVWLARDQQKEAGRLVTLKALRADISCKLPDENPELVVPRSLLVSFPESGGDFQTIEDHFTVRGPNGSHLFLISPLAGPSVLAMSDSPGRVSGSRRLRGDLARKVAKEAAKAMYCMHSAGWVHGGELSSTLFYGH
jgi:serine/threonine protein kinase